MPDIILRNEKGDTLTHSELDGNFTNLDTRVAKPDKIRGGWANYSDVTTATTPISVTGGSTWYKITNDAAGAFTTEDYLPEGVTSLWDEVNGQFDFTELSLGDMINLNMLAEITTSSVDQEVFYRFSTGIGSSTPFIVPAPYAQYKAVGTYSVSINVHLPVQIADFRDYPTEVQINSGNDCTFKVTGFYIEVLLRGEAS